MQASPYIVGYLDITPVLIYPASEDRTMGYWSMTTTYLLTTTITSWLAQKWTQRLPRCHVYLLIRYGTQNETTECTSFLLVDLLYDISVL